MQQQNTQPRHRQFGRVRAAGEFTYCDQTSAEEVRSPAFRSARLLSHGARARCACRSGWSARMRARALSGPGRGWYWHRQLHWIPGTMSAMSTTMRTLACALPWPWD